MENARLDHTSAPTRHDKSKFIVELEVFHQLHCLKWIRDRFWETELAALDSSVLAQFPQRRNHTDHCIDYLRQAIIPAEPSGTLNSAITPTERDKYSSSTKMKFLILATLVTLAALGLAAPVAVPKPCPPGQGEGGTDAAHCTTYNWIKRAQFE
ncbi:hypothetical protein TI39_contig4194g00002 [Zymoseptoria brevis]|uniref:Uncharacterized protein n=1 Tax=Zymoseptoria brevis TaxID=1047168 RepID=A0A0F4GBT0_9PEZI|nr:hypothetical protein TI39_contig4194g00002 [Zymoseptoria brevis]